MENIENLFKGKNKTQSEGNIIKIYINIPEDCIFDISEFIITYNVDSKNVAILNTDVPQNIQENILKFYSGNLLEFLENIESNFDTFLSGKVPDVDEESYVEDEVLDTANYGPKEYQLPSNYQFPTEKLKSLNLEVFLDKRNINVFSCKNINVQVECKRCKKKLSLTNSQKCNFCKSDLIMEYIPTVNEKFLGFLKLENCVFICLNYTKYQFSCLECGANYESKDVGIGSSFSLKCYLCGYDVSFKILDIRFIGRIPVDVKSKKSKLEIGKSLPDNGTCKHYRRSFRWFRFPCCGSLFPCDICHDDESNHVHEMANKMVCGLCSKEQGVKNECSCGMSAKKSTSHWEGGKGTRNKALMSKKESRKYK